jgi:hypothetical protein
MARSLSIFHLSLLGVETSAGDTFGFELGIAVTLPAASFTAPLACSAAPLIRQSRQVDRQGAERRRRLKVTLRGKWPDASNARLLTG